MCGYVWCVNWEVGTEVCELLCVCLRVCELGG